MRFGMGFLFSLYLTFAWIGLRMAWHQLCWFFSQVTDAVFWSWLTNEAWFHFKWFGIIGVVLGLVMLALPKPKPKKKANLKALFDSDDRMMSAIEQLRKAVK